jgi:hypothetical protein
LLDVAREIDEIATLKPGWDGHDAPVLSGLVASRAFLLLLSLEDATGGAVPLPATVAPIADGGLQLEWDRDRLQIEVQVAPDGTYGYLLIHDPFGSERYEEADDLTLAAMIQVLLDAFRRRQVRHRSNPFGRKTRCIGGSFARRCLLTAASARRRS